MYRVCSHILAMTDNKPRRTPTHKVRRTISEILERIDAIEYSVGVYQHKGNHAELERARENFLTLRRLFPCRSRAPGCLPIISASVEIYRHQNVIGGAKEAVG
jgi:hypothetical protein